MANVLSKPSYTNTGGRSGFDLSHRYAFSSSVGQLLPIFADELYPGDHIKLSADMFTRTEPLQKAAFTRVTEHIDYFFVPFTQLYSIFDAFIYSVDDIRQSIFTPSAVNVEYLPMLHYNEFSQAFQEMQYNPDPEVTPPVYVDKVDEFGETYLNNAYRLLDLLGYGTGFYSQFNVVEGRSFSNMPSLSPFRLAAYQKIFYDYYRLTDWTVNDPSAYNLDKFYDGQHISKEVIGKLLTLHYRPWKRDYFTSVLPSPLVGSSSTNILPNIKGDLKQWLYATNVSQVARNGDGNNPLPTTVQGTFSTNGNNTTVQNSGLRTAFAYEKLLEITRRAGKHYDQQTLAHFGVQTPRRVDGDVFYLGSQSSPVQISDVVATASTESAPLGEIGGKGYSAMNGNGVDFTANCHGILMAIYSAVPESDYAHTGIDRQNTYLQKYDFFTPELDDIGMQPLFKSDGNFIPNGSPTNSQIMGWQYRFMESKARYDQTHGKFVTVQTGWMAYRNTETQISDSIKKYYINPSYLNPIMEVSYLMPSRVRFSTDPLIHDLYWKCFKTSKMSTFGLPSL